MQTFVLVHGAWHDGSAWGPVIERIQARGHRAVAPTARGHGRGANKDVDLDGAAESVVDFIVRNELRDVVLAGHSLGGIYVSKVAMAIPERIRRLVFQNAFVLDDGHALVDEIPPRFAALFDQVAAASSDNTTIPPYPVWREAFINDADAELARRAYDALSPQPYRTFTDRVDMKPFYELIQRERVACSYLNATEDVALPPGEFAWYPRYFLKLGLCRLVQMPGSHEVMFTNPALLADKLVEAGRD